MKIEDLFNIKGKVAVVTGGAQGIGGGIARVLIENGAHVVILDRDPVATASTLEALKALSPHCDADILDVTDPDAVRTAFDKIVARLGRLDIVFANAGIGGGPGFLTMEGTRNPPGAVENVAESQWDNVLSTNLDSVFYTIQAVVPHMKRQPEGGRIIVTTSIAAINTENFVGTPYFAAKAGVAQLVRQVALELARHKILVNAIAPGAVRTSIGNGRMADPVVAARFSRGNPMHRMATPDDIQGVALFLASPASSYVTGAQYTVDGGATAGMGD